MRRACVQRAIAANSVINTPSLMTIKWAVFFLLALAYSVFQMSIIMYVMLAIELVSIIPFSQHHTKDESAESFVELTVVSLMMPDNYCVIVTIVLGALLFVRGAVSSMRLLLIALTALYCLLNIVICGVPLNNIIMWCIYVIPFPIIYFVLNRLVSQSENLAQALLLQIKRLILLELVSVLAYAASHLGTVMAYNDMDWVVGTMGTYQANTLMCIAAFSLVVFLGALRKQGRGMLPWCVMAAILVVSTSSISYLAVFVVVVVAVFITSWQASVRERIALAVALVAGFVVFVAVSPAWISTEVYRMTDTAYAQNRFEKGVYYERTFLDIPSEEGISSFIFGTGLGTYSSRAALTCAGGYIDLYDSMFDSYSSPERNRYLGDQDRSKGLASMSDSSIVSMQGELGLIGLLAVNGLMAALFVRSKSPYYRIAVLFFWGLLFVDNALEYAKFYTMFTVALVAVLPPGAGMSKETEG